MKLNRSQKLTLSVAGSDQVAALKSGSTGGEVKTVSGQVLGGAKQTKITDHIAIPHHLMKQMYSGQFMSSIVSS